MKKKKILSLWLLCDEDYISASRAQKNDIHSDNG